MKNCSTFQLQFIPRSETKPENAQVKLQNTKLDKTKKPVLLTKFPPFPPFPHHQDLPKVYTFNTLFRFFYRKKNH